MDSHVINSKPNPKKGAPKRHTHALGVGSIILQNPCGAKDSFCLVQGQVRARCPFCTAEPGPAGGCALSPCQGAPDVSQFLSCHQTSQGIPSLLLPALSKGGADCRPQTFCHDHHICHLKPGLYHTELLRLRVHDTSRCYQFDGSTRRLFSS